MERRVLFLIGFTLFTLANPFQTFAAYPPNKISNRATLTGKVVEKSDGHPLGYAEIIVYKDSAIVTGGIADELGNYVLKNIEPGGYRIAAVLIGFKREEVTAELRPGINTVNFALRPAEITLSDVTVSAQRAAVALDVKTGSPVFVERDYHGSPTNLTTNIIQQSIAGAVQAPAGEIYIRGQHKAYTFYIDGVPVPPNISGSMNELFSPSIVNRISFLTGALPAEYGSTSSLVDVRTKIPIGPIGGSASAYYGAFNSFGQSLSFHSHTGNFGFFFAGTHQLTDRRLDTPLPDIFHDHGEDLYGFGKVQYIISPNDVLMLDLNWSKTKFQVPYDSTGSAFLDDTQTDVNSFQNLIYHHALGNEASSGEFSLALYHRQGSLVYLPGAGDVPAFYFAGDTIAYNIREDRSFNVYGFRSDISFRVQENFSIKLGTAASLTRGREAFFAFNASTLGPQSIQELKGHDLGGYLQTTYSPLSFAQLDVGVRYDYHKVYGSLSESQVSPRIKLSIMPNVSTNLYAYYGRLFVPVNIEALREITSAEGLVGQPTEALRSNYFEIGFLKSFPVGLTMKLSGYYNEEKPGLDETTIPGTAIVTDVNVEKVFIRGSELSLYYAPEGDISAYLNLTLSHAQGVGATSGGFLPVEPPTTAFDLDHDQRITYVLGIDYHRDDYYISVLASYGSGLTSGENQHVNPHLVFNGSIGGTFRAGRVLIRPEFFVNNILDHNYLLKGTFFSGAIWGAPRTAVFRISVSI